MKTFNPTQAQISALTSVLTKQIKGGVIVYSNIYKTWRIQTCPKYRDDLFYDKRRLNSFIKVVDDNNLLLRYSDDNNIINVPKLLTSEVGRNIYREATERMIQMIQKEKEIDITYLEEEKKDLDKHEDGGYRDYLSERLEDMERRINQDYFLS